MDCLFLRYAEARPKPEGITEPEFIELTQTEIGWHGLPVKHRMWLSVAGDRERIPKAEFEAFYVLLSKGSSDDLERLAWRYYSLPPPAAKPSDGKVSLKEMTGAMQPALDDYRNVWDGGSLADILPAGAAAILNKCLAPMALKGTVQTKDFRDAVKKDP